MHFITTVIVQTTEAAAAVLKRTFLQLANTMFDTDIAIYETL